MLQPRGRAIKVGVAVGGAASIGFAVYKSGVLTPAKASKSTSQNAINKKPIAGVMDDRLYEYLLAHTREPEVRSCRHVILLSSHARPVCMHHHALPALCACTACSADVSCNVNGQQELRVARFGVRQRCCTLLLLTPACTCPHLY